MVAERIKARRSTGARSERHPQTARRVRRDLVCAGLLLAVLAGCGERRGRSPRRPSGVPAHEVFVDESVYPGDLSLASETLGGALMAVLPILQAMENPSVNRLWAAVEMQNGREDLAAMFQRLPDVVRDRLRQELARSHEELLQLEREDPGGAATFDLLQGIGFRVAVVWARHVGG